MNQTRRRHPFSLLPFVSLLAALAWLSPVRADTVASLLGNFTINQFCGLTVEGEGVSVHFVVVFGQLPALRELHFADSNADGVTTPAERDAYLARLAIEYARGLQLVIDGIAVPLRVRRLSSSLPSEQSGFSLRFDVDFVAAFPAAAPTAGHRLEFANSNYQGRIGWHEIEVKGIDGISLYDASAFGNSLTDGLAANPKSLPPEGPLDERTAQLSFVAGPVPAGAVPLRLRAAALLSDTKPRAGTGVDGIATRGSSGNWLAVQTRRLLDLISAPTVPVHIKLFALLGALLLGALHAFSPGHGKTVVGAYLIGSRGTPRHAAFLGLIVTVTHTLGVFLLGFATLFAAHYVVPERLFPVITLISGLLVVGIGASLLVQRFRAWRRADDPGRFVPVEAASVGAFALAPIAPPFSLRHQHHHHERPGPHTHSHDHRHGPSDHPHDDGHSHAHGHDHSHGHDSRAGHAHHGNEPGDGGLVHSHGGSVHSHLPAVGPGERITWRSLLALGVSGGLIPCPSAMVLLLAAIALNRTALGLLLVVAFSIGLAATLTLVGLAFLYARQLFPRLDSSGRWARQLPIASAALITLVGVVICYGAIAGKGVIP